jgi:membrane fusion protein (multidrug efflux system)
MASPEGSAPDQASTHASAEPVESPPQSAPEPPRPPVAAPPRSSRRRWVSWTLGAVGLFLVLFEGVPWVRTALRSVSTDDAYVNGHVTFVAARVPGQVTRVLVDDNNRVRTGDLLVELDKEPYQVQVNIAQAAVEAAQANFAAAQAETRGIEGQARSLRFNLDHAIEDVDNQVSLLRSRVAALDSYKAALARAQDDYNRAVPLLRSGSVTAEELDHRKQALRDAQAQLDAAVQGIYQLRVSLGLPPTPPTGHDLAEVPPDLDQTFSTVREAQAKLIEAVAKLGLSVSFEKSPKEMIADFYKRDAQGDIDRILAQILTEAPGIAQAAAKLSQAQRDLDEAKLNLHYTDVVAEIDGVITRREVNPGNNVVAGQSLMAIRSLTDIWVDANFKETQLADLRIGQPVDLYVDMYGTRQVFEGRVSGFTMGTGSTLALLPPENATGNFVKVVQRLPVRIDLVDYDPDKAPLFIGLSVRPYVHVREKPTGPDAGKVLQPHVPQPTSEPSASQTAR